MVQTKNAQISQDPIFEDITRSILRSFWKYHSVNPNVFDLFVKYSFQLKRAGRKRYGAKAIFERIRWHFAIETVGEEFKISNNYTSCYARLLILTHPEFKDFFQLKSVFNGKKRG